MSLFGWGFGVLESAGQTAFSLTPGVSQLRTFIGAYERGQRIVAAYDQHGLGAARDQYLSEVKDYTMTVVKSLPIINTIRQISAIEDAYNAGSFEGGRQVGRATFSLAGDVPLIYGGVKASTHILKRRLESRSRIPTGAGPT